VTLTSKPLWIGQTISRRTRRSWVAKKKVSILAPHLNEALIAHVARALHERLRQWDRAYARSGGLNPQMAAYMEEEELKAREAGIAKDAQMAADVGTQEEVRSREVQMARDAQMEADAQMAREAQAAAAMEVPEMAEMDAQTAMSRDAQIAADAKFAEEMQSQLADGEPVLPGVKAEGAVRTRNVEEETGRHGPRDMDRQQRRIDKMIGSGQHDATTPGRMDMEGPRARRNNRP